MRRHSNHFIVSCSFYCNYLLTAPGNIQTAVIRRAASGDTDAQAWLYQQYSRAMYNICIRMTGHVPDAEDVLHDAFISAFDALGSLKDPAAFGGWLKQIVINTCIRRMKKAVTWQEWQYEAHEHLQDEAAAWWTTVSLARIHEAIKKLPDGCREIFVLYALEDFQHKQIAAQLGITEGTSKSQYHRARKLLRESITSQILTNG